MGVRVTSRIPALRAAFFSIAVAIATFPSPRVEADDPPPAPSVPPDPIPLDLGIHVGFAYRLGDARAFPITERAGASFSVSAYLSPRPLYAFGLAFEHIGLGSERAEGELANVNLVRDLDVLWAGMRVHLLRTETVRLGLLLGPGLAWQSVRADGLLTPGVGTLPTAFTCAAGDTVNLALRAGLGAQFALGNGLSFVADASFDNVRLASDVIGDCAPGAGTRSSFGARLGFTYGFDVAPYVR